MRVLAPNALRLDSRHGKQVLWAITILALAAGLATNSLDEFVGYTLITMAALAPAALWLRMGARGVPVLPIAGTLYYLYYALPILSGNLGAGYDGYYSSEDILAAALTVTMFVGTVTFCWWLTLQRVKDHQPAADREMSRKQFNRLIVPGLILGLAYFSLLATGEISAVGSFSNVLRSMAVSALLVSCYTLGYGRARGILFGTQWLLCVAALCAVSILALANLFLVDGLMFVGVAGAGYTFTCKRIPWRTCLVGFAIVAILHAGKGDMRGKYWATDGSATNNTSIMAIPGRMVEWLTAGIVNLAWGTASEGGQSIVERASLFWILLRAQRLTPDYIPYLGGETYAMMPQMIIPRFVKEDKLSTTATTNLLNIRYGLQTEQSVTTTTIGWGLIAEAYANFGRLGVLGIAALLGLANGFLMRGSIGRQTMSLPSLIAVVALHTMVNLEWDFSYVVLNTGQSIVSLTMLYMLSFAGLGKKPQAPQFALRGHPVMPPAASPQVEYPADKRRLGASS